MLDNNNNIALRVFVGDGYGNGARELEVQRIVRWLSEVSN